jgi:hypothetical protein
MEAYELKPFRIQTFPVTAAVVGLLALVLLIGNSTMQWFLVGSIAVGVIVAVFLRRSHETNPIDLGDERGRPEISMHRLPVGGGAAGLIFAVGSCLIFVVGIPALRWFLLGAVVVGSAVGGFLWRWHKKRPIEITDIHDVNG